MKKNQLTLMVLSALTMAAAAPLTVSAASSTLFHDVPQGHWAYSAVEQLAKDGILTGYEDGTFRGDALMTRYDMAQIIANARTHMAKAVPADQDLITKLSDEFRDDLDELGVRVTRLEKKQENVRLTGSFAQKYEKAAHDGYNEDAEHGGTNHSTRWQKELKLNIDADVPKTPITFHATLNSQLTSYEPSGWGSEEETNDDWNGGHERRSILRPETCYVGGPLDKTGLNVRYGAFYQDVQSAPDQKNWFSVFTGRLDVKDEDTSNSIIAGRSDQQFSSSDIDWDGGATLLRQTETEYVQSYNIKQSAIDRVAASLTSGSATTDFLRHHAAVHSGSAAAFDAGKTYRVIQTAAGSNWIYDWDKAVIDYSDATYSLSGKTQQATTTRRRTLTGAAFGHRFSDHFAATLAATTTPRRPMTRRRCASMP